MHPTLSRTVLLILTILAAGLRGDPARVVLQLPYTHQFQFAGVYAAQKYGHFAAEGLEVEVRPTGGSVHSSIDEVLAGVAQYGISQGPQLVAARLAGRPVVVVAPIMQHSPLVLVTRAEDNLNTPQDLIGKRVALDRTALGSEIRLMLEREGVDFSKITVVPNSWKVNELAEGVADAMSGFVIDAPFTLRRSGMAVRIMRPVDYGVDFYGDCLFVTEEHLRTNPGQVEAFRRALLKGWQDALRDREAIIDHIHRTYPKRSAGMLSNMDIEAMRYEAGQVALLVNADLVDLGRMNPGRWGAMAQILVGYGMPGDLSRVEGMLYQPPTPDEGRPWFDLPAVRVLAGGLGLAAFLVAVALGANHRLKRLVEKRTRELEASRRRQREVYDSAPVPITENDYSRVEARLGTLRAAGVSDIRAHLAQHPELVLEACREVVVADANRMALAAGRCATVAELSERRYSMLSSDMRKAFFDEMVAIWEGREELRIEKSYEVAPGMVRSAIIHWSARRSPAGPDYSLVQLVYTDVTEIRAKERELRESEARYRALFQDAVVGIFRCGPDGRFLDVNGALARMLGFTSPGELLYEQRRGQDVRFMEAGAWRSLLQRVQEDGRVEGHECEARDIRGNVLWVSQTIRAVTDSGGRLLHFEGFLSDISAHRRLEDEMIRTSKVEAVGLLAGGIAHDFNNILAVILGNLTLAELDITEDRPYRSAVLDAIKGARRARELTHQLLTFARGGEPVKASVALPELLRDSTEFLLHGSKSRAEFELAPDLAAANADKAQLGRVIQNLVINALQAMPEGGVVTVGASNDVLGPGTEGVDPGPHVCIRVKDTGKGIAPENLGRIFDPYFSTKEHGSGLGLATVHSIVRRHRGRIGVESVPGRGTEFRVWLPAASAPTEAPRPDAPGGAGLSARLLFMDDEETIRQMTARFVARLGGEIVMARDGAEAIRLWTEAREGGRPFDAVVFDLTVPGGMGGKEAVEHLLKLDPDLRAVVSSGYSRDPVLGNHRAFGFRGILPKPYGIEQFQQAIAEVLSDTEPRR
jgi:PAS domain S-box-containing protein